MNLELGPFALRVFSADNWTSLELAFASNKNGGMARRETALRSSFKSEHLLDTLGVDNPADTFECPATGTLYFGKIQQTPTGVHAISAREVYTRAIYERACKDGLKQATEATAKVEAAAA
jgi:hypothetical protein